MHFLLLHKFIIAEPKKFMLEIRGSNDKIRVTIKQKFRLFQINMKNLTFYFHGILNRSNNILGNLLEAGLIILWLKKIKKLSNFIKHHISI